MFLRVLYDILSVFASPADPGSRTPDLGDGARSWPIGVLLEGSWGGSGRLLDAHGRLLGGFCSLLGSWSPLRAPLEAPWSALEELLGVSWRCLGDSWRVLGGVWRSCGGVLEASWRHLKGSWALLRASWKRLVAVCLIIGEDLNFQWVSLIFEVLGACGTLRWRLKTIQNNELIMGTREPLEAS